MVSKAKTISTKLTNTLKAGKLPVKGGVKKVVVKQKTSSVSKSTGPKSQPVAGHSKQKPVPEKSGTSVKESVVVPKETAEGDKPANKTVAQPSKGKVTEAKVRASKAEKASTTQKPQTTADKLAAAGGAVKEKVKETSTKAGSVPSESTAPESRPDLESSKPKESETKVKGDVVVPNDTETVSDLEPEHQAKLDKTNDTKDVEPMQPGETGVEAAEPMEVESAVETQPSEQSVQESSEQGLETKTEASQIQQQAGGSPTVEAKLPGGGVQTKTMHNGMLETGWMGSQCLHVACNDCRKLPNNTFSSTEHYF